MPDPREISFEFAEDLDIDEDRIASLPWHRQPWRLETRTVNAEHPLKWLDSELRG
ncbi:MAG: hypothetical protein MUO68_03745 [Desulfobacteraceae bacterium]|nr:hypothetical protein [Desulfobacteraceae bacterium]